MVGERSPGMRAEVVHLDAMPDVRPTFVIAITANCWVQSYDERKIGMAIPTGK